MQEILEIKGKIYEVIDGQVTKIKVDDTIFEIKSSEEKKESFIEDIPSVFTPKEKGQRVGAIKKCTIYENILNDIRNGISEGKSNKDLMNIVKEYTPIANSGTLHWYVNMYKRYISEKETKPVPTFEQDRGKVVGHLNKLNICENVLNEISEGINQGNQQENLTSIIKKYYPNTSYATKRTYLSIYRRFLGHPQITKQGTDRGKIVSRIKGTPIHEKVLKDISEEYQKGNLDFEPILKRYYPDLTINSIRRYAYSYRKYFDIEIGRGERINKTFFRPRKTIPKKRRRKKQKPKEAVGFCKTYKTWITKEEYQKVKSAINSWNFVATTQSVSKKTGIPEQRIRATLRYLVDKHEAYWKRNEDSIPIYHPCI